MQNPSYDPLARIQLSRCTLVMMTFRSAPLSSLPVGGPVPGFQRPTTTL